MDVTAASIRRDRVTAVAVLVLLAAGLQAYANMPRQLDPGFIIRTAQVRTFFPGASPERVEQLITDPIEEVVQEIPELDFVESQSRTGVSLIFVNVKEEYTEMRPIWDDLRRKVERIATELPDGVQGPYVDDEFGDVFGILLTITGVDEGFSYRELEDVAEEVRDAMLRAPDVAKVEIHGAQEERVFVEYDNARLAQLGLSPMALNDLLEQRNIIVPGGDIDLESETIVLEPSGNFASVEELARTILQLPGRDELLYLEDVADVRRGYVDPPETSVRAAGQHALGLAISMKDGGNLIELGASVRSLMRQLEGAYPWGIEFQTAFFEPATVEAKVGDFVESVLQSVVIVLAVMLLTLGLRTGTVVATLIPAAMIIAVLGMAVFGIFLDQVSLAALIIALGLLVDNAIVMSESILVRMGEGATPFDAAVGSARELRIPLLTSSLTTAAAFLPIFLAESAVGEYTASLFKVVTITLLVSWALALTMIPMLCVRFLRARPTGEDGYDSPFYRAYRGFLASALRFKWLSLGATAAVFVGSMFLFGLVPKIFFPPQDRAFFMADFTLPPGTPIDRTDAMVEAIDAHIDEALRVDPDAPEAEGVTHWTTFTGASPPRFVLSYNPSLREPYKAVYMLEASSGQVVADLIPKLQRWAIDHFPDVKTYVRRLENGPPVNKPIQVRVSGKDTDRLFEIVDEVSAKLGAVDGPTNIGDDWGVRVKKFVVAIDEGRARRAGVTNLDVAISLQTFLTGLEVTEYREGQEVIPVVMRSVAADRRDLARLETLNVFSQTTGRSVPLEQVADIELAFQPNDIKRRDRYRTVTIEAELEPGFTTAEVLGPLVPWLDAREREWGVGYRYELGGEMESSEEANASIAEKLPIAGLLIVLLLIWQFNSFRKTSIVLLTIPVSLTGVVIGLLVMRSYFGFMTLLGVISLAGIVINNAIVLLERIALEIDEAGRSPQRAILESAQRRLRPILLTTTTTVASLIPLYLGGGPMFEPMAVAIMFGLVFATALTLGLVPILYSILFRVDFAGWSYDEDRARQP